MLRRVEALFKEALSSSPIQLDELSSKIDYSEDRSAPRQRAAIPFTKSSSISSTNSSPKITPPTTAAAEVAAGQPQISQLTANRAIGARTHLPSTPKRSITSCGSPDRPSRQSSAPPPLFRNRTDSDSNVNVAADPHLRVESKGKHPQRTSSHTSSTSSGCELQSYLSVSLASAENLESDDEFGLEAATGEDDDDVYNAASFRDVMKEALMREPKDRSEEDIDVLLEALQSMPALCNMSHSTRRSLCAVMFFAVVERAGTVVIEHGEQLDSWCVIVSGAVQVLMPNGERYKLLMGDSFGVSATLEREIHCGQMRTLEDECQFVCVKQRDYQQILANEQQNEVHIRDEEGRVCLVKEYRALDSGGCGSGSHLRRGQIVVRGTPHMLIDSLLESHSVHSDPNYVEDFLLTYRTFLPSPRLIADRLLNSYENVSLRDRVTRVVLLWVNNHFNDFESEPRMMEFLAEFEKRLTAEHKVGECHLLHIACTTKASFRDIQLHRSTKDEMLRFSILGGLGEASGIFVNQVQRDSKAANAGLRHADQIIAVNGHRFEHVVQSRALDLLKNATHLAMTVRFNPLGFHEAWNAAQQLCTQRNLSFVVANANEERTILPVRQCSSPEFHVSNASAALPLESDVDSKSRTCGLIRASSSGSEQNPQLLLPPSGAARRQPIQSGSTSKYRKIGRLQRRFTLYDKSDATDSISSEDAGLKVNSLGRNSTLQNPVFSSSNPDLSRNSSSGLPREALDHVIKVYRDDQKFRYLSINKETSAREVVMLAVQYFGITEPSINFSLCKVLVDQGPVIRRRVLADSTSDLALQLELSARYYLRNNAKSQDVLANDEVAREILKESCVTLPDVPPIELATRLTLDDYDLFRSVKATEYVEKICQLKLNGGTLNLDRFEALCERENFWVQTELVKERNISARVRLLKYFIKLAQLCREFKNFNSMMSLLQGLSSRPVQHLKSSWDALPNKYHQIYSNLETALDVSRNMAKYRSLLKNEHVQPPIIPYYPIVSKDLTSIHVCNDALKDGLVNFDKLRMLAREVRLVCQMCDVQYDPCSMIHKSRFRIYSSGGGPNAASNNMNKESFAVIHSNASSGSASVGAANAGDSTVKRVKRRSAVLNPKRIYEEAQLAKHVRAYLNNMEVITDSRRLESLSSLLESGNNSSAASSATSSRKTSSSQAPLISVDSSSGFGGSCSADVQKLLGLSEGKTRPTRRVYSSSNSLQLVLPTSTSTTVPEQQMNQSIVKRPATILALQLSADSGALRPALSIKHKHTSASSCSSCDSGVPLSPHLSRLSIAESSNGTVKVSCQAPTPLSDYHEMLRQQRQQQQQYRFHQHQLHQQESKLSTSSSIGALQAHTRSLHSSSCTSTKTVLSQSLSTPPATGGDSLSLQSSNFERTLEKTQDPPNLAALNVFSYLDDCASDIDDNKAEDDGKNVV